VHGAADVATERVQGEFRALNSQAVCQARRNIFFNQFSGRCCVNNSNGVMLWNINDKIKVLVARVRRHAQAGAGCLQGN